MKSTVLALALAAIAAPSLAFEVTGGSVTLEYSTFADSALTDVNKTGISGSMEMGFSRSFAMQTDLSFVSFGTSGLDATNSTIHGIYHLNETTSLGAFIASEKIEDGSGTSYGLEVGHQSGALGYEAFLSRLDGGDTGTGYGVRGNYAMSDRLGLGLRLEGLNTGEFDVTRLSATGEFGLAGGAAVTAELGTVNLDDAGSEAFVALGFRYDFGAKRGATFSKRGLTDILPGF